MTTRPPASDIPIASPRRERTTPRQHHRLALAVLVLAMLLPGCAVWKKAEPLVQSPLGKKRQERREQARKEFENGRNEAELQAAMTAWDQGNIKGCEQSLQGVLKRQPKHREARLLMADVCLAGGNTDAAAQHIERALSDHPEDAQVQYSAALLCDAVGQQDEALAFYRRAATLAPDNEVFRIGYYAAREAANRRNAGRPNPFAAVAGLLPGEAVASGVQPAGYPPPGRAQAQKPRANTQTRSDKMTYADPADLNGSAANETAATLIQRGRVALSEGNKEAAVATFREALALSPHDPQIPLSAATAALRYDQPQIAVQILKAVEPRMGDSAAIQRALGLAYYRAGDYASAQSALQQALSLDKSSGLSYFLLGCTLAKSGQHEAAEGYLRQAETLDPRYTMRR